MGTFTDGLRAIAVILRTVRQPLSLKSIITYTVFIAITSSIWLITKQLEKLIDATVLLEQKIDNITPKEIFAQQFSIEYINIDGRIHDQITELHGTNQVGWTLLIGIHNGALMGPFHLRKVSVLDERIARDKHSLAKEIQNMPIIMFKHDLNAFWGARDLVIARKTHSLPQNVAERRELERLGVYYEIFKPLYVENLSVPFAFLTVYLTETEYKELSETELTKLEKTVYKQGQLIEYEFQRMYNLQNINPVN